jgi:uncharacterized protein
MSDSNFGESLFEKTLEPFVDQIQGLIPSGADPFDAHTHLGLDEDERHLDPLALLSRLRRASIRRACVFALHDPARRPAYRVPNDRVLAWSSESKGALIPFCRLDPAESPVEEAERCLAAGARGIKLHPHSDGFNFRHGAMKAIFGVAKQAKVPVLVHCGPGVPSIIDGLTDVALDHPDVTLILAHAGVANLGLFVSRLAQHPSVLFDTAWFSPFDLLDLFGRIPAERIVFGSDPPYGHPAAAIYLVLRLCRRIGVDSDTVRAILGGTLSGVLESRALTPTTRPRATTTISMSTRLARICGYALSAFGGIASGSFDRVRHMVVLALGVCADPEPGDLEPVLRLTAPVLEAASELLSAPETARTYAAPLIHIAAAIAATS